MRKEKYGVELTHIGLFKVFSNMDTQSAVVAALVISFVTVLATGFINLCNYIYWSAYFTKFNIPLAYIDEAIIHESGTKYAVVLAIPLVAVFWWLLTAVRNAIVRQYHKLKEKRDNKFKDRPVKRADLRVNAAVKIVYAFVIVLCWFVGTVALLLWCIEKRNYIILIFAAELSAFLLHTLCSTTFGKKRRVSGKLFYGIRIFFVFFVVYAVLAGVYFSGSMNNYENAGAQSLKIVNDSNVNFFTLKSEDTIRSQLVLLETKDYYYVTDVEIVGGSTINVRLWDDDTYRFIDKIDCPVKTVWAYLSYIGSGRDVTWKLMNDLSAVYAIVTFALSITFVCMLSVPKREEDPEKTVKPHTND